MRLSTILYFMIPLLLLSLIGCSDNNEKKANGIFEEALVLIDSGYYSQSLETIDMLIETYPKSEQAINLQQGVTLIKGHTYKVFKNNIAPSRIAREEMPLIGRALETYAEDNLAYPTNEQGLNALINKPTLPPQPRDWRGPYIKRTNFKDPWGNPYQYKLILRYTNRYGYDLYSFGPDSKYGGGDDIRR
jgi:type II secretion system protein G